jgi:hypothetical protein
MWNIIVGGYGIYALRKMDINKSAKLIPTLIVLFSILGILVAISLWNEPLRFVDVNFILVETVSIGVAGVGITAFIIRVFFSRRVDIA